MESGRGRNTCYSRHIVECRKPPVPEAHVGMVVSFQTVAAEKLHVEEFALRHCRKGGYVSLGSAVVHFGVVYGGLGFKCTLPSGQGFFFLRP